MKNIIQRMAIVVLAVFSVNTVIAQNPHFNNQNDPSVTATCTSTGVNSSVFIVRVAGTAYGCGNASTVQAHLNYTYSSNFNCFNRGNDAGPVPGQSGPVSGQTADVTLNVTNGNAAFDISFNIGGSCKGNALSSTVTSLVFSQLDLVINGKTVKPSCLNFLVTTNCQ
jgi:hypothetical protein